MSKLTATKLTSLGFQKITADNKEYYVFAVNKYPLLTSVEVTDPQDIEVVCYGSYLKLKPKEVENYVSLFNKAKNRQRKGSLQITEEKGVVTISKSKA